VLLLDVPSSELAPKVEEYLRKVSEIESEIKAKEEEHERERLNPKNLRKRQLSEITNDIRGLRDQIWRLKPDKKCPNCDTSLSYDTMICWECGEVFFDVCPKCKSLSVHKSEWELLECSKYGLSYREIDLIKDLLKAGADPYRSHFSVLESGEHLSIPCYNVGVKRNTIWELCKDDCPHEEKCEYFCPAFLSILGLIWRGKVTIELPWGYDQGGDLHAYKIRWKRLKRLPRR
jgi:Zn-finger nucleic acid-binding protein